MHDDDPLAPGGPRRPPLLLAAEPPPQLVRQAASSGSWERVRRGVYRETGTSRRIGPADERDLAYQWERPYVLDDTAARDRFGIEPTPWDEVCRRTARG